MSDIEVCGVLTAFDLGECYLEFLTHKEPEDGDGAAEGPGEEIVIKIRYAPHQDFIVRSSRLMVGGSAIVIAELHSGEHWLRGIQANLTPPPPPPDTVDPNQLSLFHS